MNFAIAGANHVVAEGQERLSSRLMKKKGKKVFNAGIREEKMIKAMPHDLIVTPIDIKPKKGSLLLEVEEFETYRVITIGFLQDKNCLEIGDIVFILSGTCKKRIKIHGNEYFILSVFDVICAWKED